MEQGLQPAQPAHRGWAASNTCRETPTCIKHMCVVGPTTGAGWVGRPQHMQRDAYLRCASSGAGGTVGAEGTRWLQHVQRGADLDCANGGRLAC